MSFWNPNGFSSFPGFSWLGGVIYYINLPLRYASHSRIHSGTKEKNTPPKTNGSPLKNSGWKTILSFWNGPFLGDMLDCGGVYRMDIFFSPNKKFSSTKNPLWQVILEKTPPGFFWFKNKQKIANPKPKTQTRHPRQPLREIARQKTAGTSLTRSDPETWRFRPCGTPEASGGTPGGSFVDQFRSYK